MPLFGVRCLLFVVLFVVSFDVYCAMVLFVV